MKFSKIAITGFATLCALGFASCSESEDGSGEKFTQTPHIVCGKVEKGSSCQRVASGYENIGQGFSANREFIYNND